MEAYRREDRPAEQQRFDRDDAAARAAEQDRHYPGKREQHGPERQAEEAETRCGCGLRLGRGIVHALEYAQASLPAQSPGAG